jgi:YD repeat-containing protein
MKINRIIIISSILISNLVNSQDLTLTDLNLNGKVKSITETSYHGKFTANGYVKVQKGWESKWQQDSRTDFDSEGNKVMETFYDSDSKVSRVEKFAYTNGRLIKSEMLYHTRTYLYNSFGKLTFMKEINRQPSQINASNENVPVKERESSYKFIYDDNDRLAEKIEIDSKGVKVGLTRYKYDEKGRLIKEETLLDDYSEWYDYSYDSNGKINVKTWSDSDEGTLEKVTYVYENKILAKEFWENYADGVIEGKVTYTYEKGNEKEVIETDESGSIDTTWSYQYQYDSNGNWIEQIAIIDKEEIYIIEREIEYY